MATTQQVKKKGNNKKGVGGFGDNPEHINKGGRYPRGESFTYWYGVFKRMTLTELKAWQKDNPENTRTVASDLAFTRIVNAKEDLKEFQEVANRSEGMPKQKIEQEVDDVHREDTISAIKEAIDYVRELHNGERQNNPPKNSGNI